MKNRFIDKFKAILLDMGNTFMFDVDRFGKDENYYETYCQLGGQHLSLENVHGIITSVFNQMLDAARDPLRYDDFGDVSRFLRNSVTTQELPDTEVELIVKVFSQHEVGKVPETHAEALHHLRSTHRLGIVSNIWSPSEVFEKELYKAGVRDLFDVCIWSSDYLSIKPSPLLFQKALDAFNVDSDNVLYVGDNPKRDVAGAKALGIAVAWIENEIRPLTPEVPKPDLIISDLTQLHAAGENSHENWCIILENNGR